MADNRIELPDGAWADLRSPRSVTRGARKPVRTATARLNRYRDALRELSGEKYDPPVRTKEEEKAVQNAWQLSPEEIEIYDSVQEPLTVALIEAWSFDAPITVDGLNEIPAQDADALIIHCSPMLDDLFVDTATPDTESEDSPT